MGTDHEVTGPINIGNPNEFTMLELAQLVLEIVGGDTGIEHRPLPSDDPTQRQPDITLAKSLLDWQPTVELREGLTATVEFFRTAGKG
jgi:nucleoside-diphosphate-sugar epimerase